MKNSVTWKNHEGTLLDTVNNYDVIDCKRCGFKHIIPIPDPEELNAVYADEYYSEVKPDYIKQYGEDSDWWNIVYGERYDTFELLLSPNRRKILDIGSGPGHFLVNGRRRGWQTLGVEPSQQAVLHTRNMGVEVIEGFLDDQMACRLGEFDVIHLSEVMEHIPDPVEMLNRCKQILKSEGLICVVVPNDYNPFQHILRTVNQFKPWWVAPPHHINYFDIDSIENLLSDHGFEIVFREATFPMELFLLMGDNYVGNDQKGRDCHAKRKMFEHVLAKSEMKDLKHNLYQAFASVGIGREIQIIGRKE